MFDIGFSELVLVFVVGLVVLGPKRLPIAIRTVMGWVRTIRGLAANVQNELAQELKLQELQESIKKAEQLNLSQLSPELGKTVEELKQSADKMQVDLNNAKSQIQTLADQSVEQVKADPPAELAQSSINTSTDLQENDQNQPLVANESELSPEELAELAEEEQDKLMAYYPPDDDFATVEQSPEQDKKNVS